MTLTFDIENQLQFILSSLTYVNSFVNYCRTSLSLICEHFPFFLQKNSAIDKMTRPAVLMEEFLKPGSQGEVTLLDMASGRLEHLNLKHVVGDRVIFKMLNLSIFVLIHI